MSTIPKAKTEEWTALADEAIREPATPALREAVAAIWRVAPTHVAVDRALLDMLPHERVEMLLHHRGVHPGKAVPALLSEREEMLSLLREVEWRAGTAWAIHEQGTQPNRPACPVCWAEDEDGHAPDCRLAAAIGSGR